jgi:hypothetical protein
MEDIAQAQLRGRIQAEEQFARWMQRRERNLELVAEGTTGHQSSEGSTAKQSRQMGELIDMEIVGENSSHEIGIGNSRRTGGMQFEKRDRAPSDLEEALAPWQYQGQEGGLASPMVKRREFLPDLEGVQHQWQEHLKLAEEGFGYPLGHLQ